MKVTMMKMMLKVGLKLMMKFEDGGIERSAEMLSQSAYYKALKLELEFWKVEDDVAKLCLFIPDSC